MAVTNVTNILASEKLLYADLLVEAIQIHGHDVYYLDRTLVAEDTVLGEDSLSKFNTQAPIEMYMENSDGGYAGEQEVITQFGLENLSEATFVVSKIRFQEKTKQIQIEDGTDSTSSGSILLESGSISESKLEGEIFYIQNETDATDADRPLEGDAIYHPLLKKLFEINFVDHDDPFHQLDTNPVYKMRCRLFDYGSETLETGITDIDAIEDSLSVASSDYQFTLEDETGSILLETSGDEYLIQEDYIVGDGVTDKTAQNELFETLDDTILDFSESNPFGDAGSAD